MERGFFGTQMTRIMRICADFSFNILNKNNLSAKIRVIRVICVPLFLLFSPTNLRLFLQYVRIRTHFFYFNIFEKPIIDCESAYCDFLLLFFPKYVRIRTFGVRFRTYWSVPKMLKTRLCFYYQIVASLARYLLLF